MMESKLYIIPTPIGNLKDITLRALEVLKESDVIYCEDSRNTIKLLNHYNIKGNLISYHEHNENSRIDEILENLRENKVLSLVSDAGMPGISDPGHVIIKKLIEEKMPFEVLPGPSATITALVLSGLDNEKFSFLGFFPRKNKDRNEFLEDLKNRPETVIIYESVHRIVDTLKNLSSNFPNRQVAVIREMTKIYEEVIRGSLQEVYDIYREKENVKGEFVIVLDSYEVEEKLDIKKLLEIELEKGLTKKSAISEVSKKYGLRKNEVYQISLEIGDGLEE
ncbi:16S rRNA (cytidine(1402)-2'-O)-methyltransferase [Lagierella sp.]|uniref:16S rRNA (cytidine(1402)-2'-O)-methyltransferase n=1 Tax=Lagierella sp. TaxID=2849657 RepID=UPI00261F0BDC|nr:16S rRNA (cytidine(1402)-2'-O)-methyltransferase [Lagierella sp.]